MRFVADESCAKPVIGALRAAGHEVFSIAESAPGTPDEEVLERAHGGEQVLITEDTDFGELVFLRARPSAGVVLIRFNSRVRGAKPKATVAAIDKLGPRLRGGFAVVEPGRVRLVRRPERWRK